MGYLLGNGRKKLIINYVEISDSAEPIFDLRIEN